MVPIHWFLFIKWKRKRAWVLVIGALRSLSQNSGQERFHFVLPLQIKVGTTTKSCSNFEIDTMESSLFMGDECPRLSWVTFSLKFTSQRMYIQALNCFILFKINLNLLPMHKITSPWTKFGYPRTWTPTNKNDFIVSNLQLQNFKNVFVYIIMQCVKSTFTPEHLAKMDTYCGKLPIKMNSNFEYLFMNFLSPISFT